MYVKGVFMIVLPESEQTVITFVQWIGIFGQLVIWGLLALWVEYEQKKPNPIKRCGKCERPYYEVPSHAKYVSPFLWFLCTKNKCESTVTIRVDRIDDEETKKVS